MSDTASTAGETTTQPTDPVTPVVAADPVTPAAVTPTSDTPPATTETPQPVTPAAEPATPPADAAKTPPVAPVIPESYELRVEGVEFRPEAVAALTPAFKAAGLTQDQVSTIAAAYAQLQSQAPAQMLERDLAVSSKDPSLGLQNWGKTQGFVKTAMDAFGDPAFGKFVNEAGIGNRLEFVRVFERIGRLMTGDVPLAGNPDGAPKLTTADKLYGRSSQ